MTLRLLALFTLLASCQGTGPYSWDDDGDGFTELDGDCDDGRADLHPGALEVCNGLDDDCDGLLDDEDPSLRPETWYADLDGDGHAGSEVTERSCEGLDSAFTELTDCDDGDPAVVAFRWYADRDGDGHPGEEPVEACEAPPDHHPVWTDCDDSRDDVHPDALDIYDDLDNDCDGRIDAPRLPMVGGLVFRSAGVAAAAGSGRVAVDALDERGIAVFQWPPIDGFSAGSAPSGVRLDGTVRGIEGDGDWSGDGRADLLAWGADATGLSSVWLLPVPEDGWSPADEAEAVFTSDQGDLFASGAGDGDGDGVAGLWVGDSAGREALLFRGPVAGRLQPDAAVARLALPDGASLLGGRDLDGDGAPDVVVADPAREGGAAWLLGGPLEGEVDLSDAAAVVSGSGIRRAVLPGDLDGDGIQDLMLWTDARDGGVPAVLVLHGPPPARATAHDAEAVVRVPDVRAPPGSLASPGDLDGDERPDLVLAETVDGIEGLWLVTEPLTGTLTVGVVGSRVTTAVPHRWDEDWEGLGDTIVGLGDLDGDGHAELAVAAPGEAPDGALWLLSPGPLYP